MRATIAPLRNVMLFSKLMETVMNRPAHLPGLGVCNGYSGFGKTFSATYAAQNTEAYYVECGWSWTQKKFCEALCIELGLRPKGTIGDMVDEIIKALIVDARPVIIDEFDCVVKRGYVDLVREIHMQSDAPFILIGEEHLPRNLEKWERFHNRVLSWMVAQPSDLQDTKHLAKLYCPGLEIDERLLDLICDESSGRARRICVNLERVNELSKKLGRTRIGSEDWGGASFFTGRSPKRKRAA